jgi:hypothetical protein
VAKGSRTPFDAADVIAALAGATLGLAAGFVAASTVGRINTKRLRSAVDRWRGRVRDPRVWTREAADMLEARVLDQLRQDVVLARRAIRVSVLGMGLVELTGRVLHTSEIALAGDIAQRVEGVDTVLNHLIVQSQNPKAM